MENLKLLNEDYIAESQVVHEDNGNGQKHMYITGPFLQAVDKNRNGRVYPLSLIEREVKKFQGLIESREAIGELSHPNSIEINPERSAILVTSLTMDGNLAMGKAKVLSTPCGKILESLLNDGVRMGVSSRGTGNLNEDSTVADDYSLCTIDAVYMPSAQVAYSDAMYESVQYTTKWVLDESTHLYIEQKVKIEEAAKEFNKKVDYAGSKAIKDAFAEFINSL